MHTVGVIGLGGFGRLVVSLVPKGTTLLGFSRSQSKAPGISTASFEQVAQASIVVLAIPLQAYPEILKKLAPLLKPKTLVIDVCSVKEKPHELFRQYLPKHPSVLMTHPLFGPNSVAKGLKRHTLVVTESKGSLAGRVLDYCEHELGLQVKQVSPKEHDQIMARVHALTFYVARALSRLKGVDPAFATPSYQMVADLIGLDRTRSNDLFTTIQKGNPYAHKIRQEFLRTLKNIDKELQDE